MSQVLLLEPDRLLAETYASFLRKQGHRVEVVATAQSAVAAADAQPPDVLIVELQLVQHSGVEFLYEFRSYGEWQRIPVIIHTHIAPAEFNGNRSFLRDQLGVVEYLHKPYTNLGMLGRSVSNVAAV